MKRPRSRKGGAKAPPRSKPIAGGSSAYRKRIEKAEARLKRERPELSPTERRQFARGHKPPPEGEARARKRKEEERGFLHWSQKQSIKRFALRQADRMNTDPHADPVNPNEMVKAALAWAQSHGYAAFERWRAKVAELGSEKRRRVRRRVRRGKATIRVDFSGRSDNVDLMEQLAEDWELGEWRWLFYH